jgi:hypothetical protein
MPQQSKHNPATKGVNRIFRDISTVTRTKNSPPVIKPKWHIKVNERTGMKFSDFIETENGMMKPMCAQWNS